MNSSTLLLTVFFIDLFVVVGLVALVLFHDFKAEVGVWQAALFYALAIIGAFFLPFTITLVVVLALLFLFNLGVVQ